MSYGFNVDLDRDSLLNVRLLSELLGVIDTEVREIESISAAGYVNTTSLSDLGVLSGYLVRFVNKAKLSESESKNWASYSLGEKVLKLDGLLTFNEKRILLPWLSSLFHMNMYYLLVDVLHRLDLLGSLR